MPCLKSQEFLRSRKLNLADYDISKNVYSDLGGMTMTDMTNYFDANVAGRKYVYCVIGKKSEMDMAVLNNLGTVKELSLEEVFGF
jgi:hypothetical protein